jgi:RNase P subunit RPR2
MYKGTGWTRGDLGNVPDPNPNVACHECGAEHRYKDYWKQRYVENRDWNPAAVYWLCDECLDQMYAEYDRVKRGREHRQLDEWGPV